MMNTGNSIILFAVGAAAQEEGADGEGPRGVQAGVRDRRERGAGGPAPPPPRAGRHAGEELFLLHTGCGKKDIRVPCIGIILPHTRRL